MRQRATLARIDVALIPAAPGELRAGARWRAHGHGYGDGSGCDDAVAAPFQIVYPAEGTRFLLDPGRSPEAQRFPLRAIPSAAGVRWTIDGAPAERFVPSPGRHVVAARLGAEELSVPIEIE